MSAGLWPHQVRAAQWLAGRQYGVLDCPMGGGKTRAAIEAARMIDVRRVLVATRTANMGDWPIEVSKGWPEADAHVLGGSTTATKHARALELWRDAGRPTWLVTNHEAVWRMPLDLVKRADLVIIDECHKIKGPQGKFSKWGAVALKNSRRWGLTGTLLPHSPLDAYGIARALGQVGGSFIGFQARHAVMGGFELRKFLALKQPQEFAAWLGTWVHKVTHEDLRGGYELPPAVHVTRRFELSAEGRRAYYAVAQSMVEEVLDGRLSMANGAIKLLRLQQASGGWLPIDGLSRQVCTAKLDALEEVLTEDLPQEPAVVFFRFTDEIMAARSMLARLGRTSYECSGRIDEHRTWKEDQTGNAVLLAQIQKASEGISLVRARAAIYFSLGFELAQYEQSQKRIHRPGQDRQVVYIHLVSEGTVDQVVYDALARRKGVVEEVLSHLAAGQKAKTA